MSRTPQEKKESGSQKWLQILVNDRPDLFDALLRSAVKLPITSPVTWFFLGIRQVRNRLAPYIVDLFGDVRDL